MTMFFVVCSKT